MDKYIIRKSPNKESVNSNLKTVEVQNTTAIALPSDHLKSENLKLQTSFIEHNDLALPLPSDRLKRHSKLLKGPCQVHLSLYPRVKFGDRFRSFQKSWYETFKWLEYSESINAAFCFCCRAFSSNNIIKKGHIDQSFIKKGFTNWKGATEAFRLHEKSQCHIDSVMSWEHLKKGIPIDVKLDKQKEITLAAREKIRLENRDIIKRLIDVIIILTKSGKIVDLLKRYDPIIKNHLEHGPKNAHYLSGKIQNELIASVHNVMFQEICKRLNGQQIAVMADETSDCGLIEQMAIVVRYFDDVENKPIELFISLERLETTDAQSIFNVLNTIVHKLKLDWLSVSSVCFDGAAAMAGHISGVQFRCKEKKL
ncbi:zinc finger MYM-type protein 1-like [Sipha flava]|uniref:Zinc finger MYM-type protein 1-like n=1 Tax=Sipha flava TaxID=143950 RepID=A0A8B8GBB6_9HEMI|nr:zinc finger MYM-type protein 1-like [Sipha flava]